MRQELINFWILVGCIFIILCIFLPERDKIFRLLRGSSSLEESTNVHSFTNILVSIASDWMKLLLVNSKFNWSLWSSNLQDHRSLESAHMVAPSDSISMLLVCNRAITCRRLLALIPMPLVLSVFVFRFLSKHQRSCIEYPMCSIWR